MLTTCITFITIYNTFPRINEFGNLKLRDANENLLGFTRDPDESNFQSKVS